MNYDSFGCVLSVERLIVMDASHLLMRITIQIQIHCTSREGNIAKSDTSLHLGRSQIPVTPRRIYSLGP